MRRLQPWTTPDNPLEALYYRGLLFRTYDTLGEYHGEILFVPPQLLATLPPLEYKPPSFSVATAGEPVCQQDDRDSLAMDVFTVLVHLRRHDVAPAAGGFLDDKALLAIETRLRGENAPERLGLLQRMIRRAGLARIEGSSLRPSMHARDWLRSDKFTRSRVLFDHWLRDKGGHELSFVSGLRWEPAGRLYDAASSRQSVISYLSQCPPDEWVSLSSFISAIRSTNPDFLRPDGDYDSWYIRETHSERLLTGFESWDRVEARLIAHIATRPLRWLGAVALGRTGDAEAYTHFHLTPLGAAYLGLAPPEPAHPEASTFTVGRDFIVRVPQETGLYDRYQIERFADWVGENSLSILYRITRGSVWRGLAQGIAEQQMILFLQRTAGGEVPSEVVQGVANWAQRFASIKLREVVLLEVSDDATLQQLRADRELVALFEDQISTRAITIAPSKMDQVITALRRLGFWPQIAQTRKKGGQTKGR
jgi:hypothetical protein